VRLPSAGRVGRRNAHELGSLVLPPWKAGGRPLPFGAVGEAARAPGRLPHGPPRPGERPGTEADPNGGPGRAPSATAAARIAGTGAKAADILCRAPADRRNVGGSNRQFHGRRAAGAPPVRIGSGAAPQGSPSRGCAAPAAGRCSRRSSRPAPGATGRPPGAGRNRGRARDRLALVTNARNPRSGMRLPSRARATGRAVCSVGASAGSHVSCPGLGEYPDTRPRACESAA
jgi:hypothetical protein